ncbi:MAG: hypothetical protein HFG80_13270 [Eubacterium sp.]|jgi:Type I restriction modification DNA specificity domain.|nr:hypothetical protein [Eubacterium sp.]
MIAPLFTYFEEEITKGDVANISSTKKNNGIKSFIMPPEKMVFYRNAMILSNSGSVGYLFYHGYPFVASDHVTVIQIRGEADFMTEEIVLYLKPVFEAMKYKYNFGREISDKRLRKEKVLLLVCGENGRPDWQYMEDYIKNLRKKVVWNKIPYIQKSVDLNSRSWEDIPMERLFEIKKGKRLTKGLISNNMIRKGKR